jgi:predicted AAA+ superfamily ATPase
MESRTLEILIDWNYWGTFSRSLIPREEYEARLGRFMEGREVIVVKGIRRAGKSSLIFSHLSRLFGEGKLRPENTFIINFEDPRLPADLDAGGLTTIFEVYMRNRSPEGRIVAVLDEVQYVKGWERFARWLSEARDAKVIVTGSSSKLMSEEYATALTGRHLDLSVAPLSFREFLKFKGLTASDGIELLRQRFRVQNLLIEYLSYGGFPEVALSGSAERKVELLRNYFLDILVKDAARRFGVEKLGKFEQLARNYVSNISSIQSFNRLKRELGISLDTVERYSSYLATAGLFTFLEKFSFSVTEQARGMKKVYAADTGFYTSSGFRFMDNMWRVMENAVAVNLLAKAAGATDLEVYYYRTESCEVDFVVKKGARVERLVQVTYASTREEVEKREVRSIARAAEAVRCGRLEVVTWDYEGEEMVEGGREVRFVPLWRWLLGMGTGGQDRSGHSQGSAGGGA